MGLQTEHERYLTEEHFKKPVIVYNHPQEIKPFYIRLNDDDRTVAAMDLLVPRFMLVVCPHAQG
jgi:asparaginyl-tRNA synthetase